MSIQDTIQEIYDVGILPVIRASSRAEAGQLVQAICAGGISAIEITMTVPNAFEVIGDVVGKYSKNVLVGAGTVLTARDAARCLDAGAEFLVSPGLSLPVLEVASARSKLAIPGALTPSEVMHAQDHGANLIKIFPCSSAGGAAHIKALQGPFPDALFIPTGGVSLASAVEYLAAGAFALGVGGELANLAALRADRTEEITLAAQKFLNIVREYRRGKIKVLKI